MIRKGQTTQWPKDEGQTTQWPKVKGQQNKQRSTKHSHKTKGKDREVLTTNGTFPWSSVTQIFNNGQPIHDGDRRTFGVMTSI
jgi:hypothetical protein